MSSDFPDFVSPMLAKLGEPFSSDEFLFEVKWDGIRAIACIDQDSYDMRTRRRNVMTPRYPEFEVLQQLPPGTVLDGEVVCLDSEGKPDFPSVIGREHSKHASTIRSNAAKNPAVFMVFDLLYRDFDPILKSPLTERRAQLQELLAALASPHVAFSDGIVGDGESLFAETCAQDLEGVVAKRMASHYAPGKRTGAWLKIKRSRQVQCLILGYTLRERQLRSLIIATNDDEGVLRCVGKVGSGLSDELRDDLLEELTQRRIPEPLIPCKIPGEWVTPGLYCTVSFMEWTSSYELRAPVFKELIRDD